MPLHTKLKTEEGYMADIYPWRDICPNYVHQTSHKGYMSHEGRGVFREGGKGGNTPLSLSGGGNTFPPEFQG